jgi:HEAT repeats
VGDSSEFTMRRTGLFVVITIALQALTGCVVQPQPTQPAPEPEPDAAAIHYKVISLMSHGDKHSQDDIDTLVALGDRAFPAYEEILSDPERRYGSMLFARTCILISKVKADRRRFVPILVGRLTDANIGIRHSAVDVLGDIGDERDAGTLLPLLSDDSMTVRSFAAKSLAKIGGKRELEGMNAWLKDGKHPEDGNYSLNIVKKCRDELEQRLKEHPVPKTLMN